MPHPELGFAGALAEMPERLLFGTTDKALQEWIGKLHAPLEDYAEFVFTKPEEAEFRSFADFLRRSAGEAPADWRKRA